MIHGQIINLHAMFNALRTPPLIANDLDVSTEYGKEELNKRLFTTYEGDSLNVVPMCGCRATRGGWLEGTTCPKCLTEVVPDAERSLESLLWLRPPKGIEMFINPHVWGVLSPRMTNDGFNYLRWMMDSSYQEPPVLLAQPKLRQLKRMGIERGMNYFYHNFDKVMEAYLEGKAKRYEKDQIKTFIDMYRDCIFTPYIPMPSKAAFVIEESANSARFHDKTMVPAINAMRIVTSIEQSFRPMTIARIEQLTMTSISEMSTYYKEYIAKTLSKKEGILRRHCFGGKLHFTFRAVITSMSGKHNYEELELPWELAVNAMRLHITNRLYRRGYTAVEVDKLFVTYARTYCDLFNDIFIELIGQPEGNRLSRIAVFFNRNPTQGRGSAQRFYVTKVNTDTNITCIRISTLTLVGFNADFDGDEMNGIVILDDYTHDAMENIAPHYNTRSMNEPGKLSKHLRLTSPVASQWARYVHRGC